MPRRTAVLRLKRGREQRARVHPWIFKGDVGDASDVAPGSVVTVVDAGGRFLGRGFFNPQPALCCRIVTWEDEPVDARLFGRRLAVAVDARARGGVVPGVGRLAWSEADGLPGLVVDRYGPVLAVQCMTLGMARVRDDIIAGLRTRVGDLAVFNVDDAVVAHLEGFEPVAGWADRPGPEEIIVDEGGVRLAARPGVGHKTGLYLDQADNQVRVGAAAGPGDVLDVFAYTGGFACHALYAGARRAVCVESSPEAIAGARRNFELNGFAERTEIRAVNAFDELRRLDRERARFDLIVLDPPPFARSRSAVEAALRGYKEINLRALRLLAPGGRLATFSCSHHVDETTFEATIRDAATDAATRVRVLARLEQAPDHPVLLTVPETRYLKGLLLQVC
ncbi:MAG TPA: class I SAM-dependent rRNA methyltransferase [Candidatus Acidoferrum sp.]|jgi:23S rRNA (cytosine1962-C5)-methyltransferase|nr:class I SAM-dependent rRNA methyltransferase [Candidatus Acidoferrum sp.]